MHTNHTLCSKQTGGFSTIEILITFAVSIIFLAAAMMIAFSDPTLAGGFSLDSGQPAALDVGLDAGALATTSSRLGAMVAGLREDWDMVFSELVDDEYTHRPDITDISPCFKQVTSETSWTTLGNRGRSTTFGTGIGSIKETQALGRGACDPTPPGDWDNPDTFGSYDPGLGPGLFNNGVQATVVTVRSVGGTLYAFVGSRHPARNTPDLWIIDVSDAANPELVSSLDLNNGTGRQGQDEGVLDLTVVEDHVYALVNGTVDQLRVVDINDIDSPTLITPFVSFEPHGVSPTGSDPQGEVIHYYDGRLFIGLKTTVGPEMLVFTIDDGPATPTFEGAIAGGFNHTIEDIVVKDDYAYLAIRPGAASVGTKELMIIDVGGTTPIDTGFGFNAQNSGNDTEGATALYLLSNRLYLARARVNQTAEQDFYIFSIANPEQPAVLGSVNLNQLPQGEITGLAVSGDLAFLGSTKNDEFQVWDMSNPAALVPYGCGGLDFPQAVSGLAYSHNLIFVSIGSNDFFRVIHDEIDDVTCN